MSMHVTDIDGEPGYLHPWYIMEELKSYSLERIPDGSGSSHFAGPSGWIYGLEMVRLDTTGLPLLNRAIRLLRNNVQVGPLTQTMVNRLEPGGKLLPHRDGLPDRLRFHLPLMTNEAALWWDELHGYEHMRAGSWYGPVPYCGVLHSVVNPGDTERIHVVCDFERR